MTARGAIARTLSVAALCWLMADAAAGAAQDDPRLDDLFDRLAATADPVEGRHLEARIWAIWIHADDEDAALLMEQGMTAMSRRLYDIALARFDLLVQRAPGFAEAWNKRATVHYLLGRYDDSVRDIERTLALEPRHFGALSGLGLIYIAIDEDAAAIRSLEAALAINPHMPGARAHLAELKRRLGGSAI